MFYISTERWEDEHYIPSAPRSEYELDDDDIVKYLDFDDLNSVSDEVEGESKKVDEVSKRAGAKDLYLELAVFFDQMGYEKFFPHVKSEDNLVDLLLGFVNQVCKSFSLLINICSVYFRLQKSSSQLRMHQVCFDFLKIAVRGATKEGILQKILLKIKYY